MLVTSHPSKVITQRFQSEQRTLLWWSRLTRLAIFNVLLWLWTYSLHRDNIDGDFYKGMNLKCSGIYVIVCAYRSFYPRIDLERYCMFDHHLSSIFLGRAAATVAEISFSIQFALLLHQLGTHHGHKYTEIVSYMIVPAITIAQACCWRGVITLDYIWHAIEESIWAVTSAIVGGCFASILVHGTDRTDIWYLSVAGLFVSMNYFAFMILVDVPMYYNRYKQSLQEKSKRFDVQKGLKDAWTRKVVTKNWNDWKDEAPWLTGYFSFAVWTSVALVHFSC